MQRILAAVGQVSHATALRATARTMLVLSVGVAMTGAILVPCGQKLDPDQQLTQGVFNFAGLLSRSLLVSLFVFAVQYVVYSRLGTRQIDSGISRRGLLLQTGRWIGWGAVLVMVEILLNPIWEFVEADPAQLLVEVAGFSVLVGAALGLLVTCSRLGVSAESSTGLATKP